MISEQDIPTIRVALRNTNVSRLVLEYYCALNGFDYTRSGGYVLRGRDEQ